MPPPIDKEWWFTKCWPIFLCLQLDTGFEPNENCLYEVEDMVLNDHQMYEMFGTGFNDSGRRWPNGQLPYRFDASIEEDEINITIAVIERFNKAMNGCLEIM